MLNVKLSKQAHKYLKKLSGKEARQLATKIQALLSDPRPNDSAELKGNEAKAKGYLRVGIGEHRIIYRVAGSTLEITLIGRRNDGDVYKQFKRTTK